MLRNDVLQYCNFTCTHYIDVLMCFDYAMIVIFKKIIYICKAVTLNFKNRDMKVAIYHVSRLSRWEFFQLLFEVLAFAEKSSEEMSETFTNKLQELRTSFDIYDKELVQQRKIPTKQLMKAERDRDFAIRKIYTLICAYSDYRFDKKKMEAATSLKRVFKRYGTGSSISRMNQDAETAVITNLLQDLAKTDSQQHITTLHLTDAVSALTTHNLIFEKEQQNRRKAQAEYVTGVVKNARKNVENDFLAFVDVVNALAIIEGEEKYADLKRNIGAMVKKHFALAKQRTRKKEEES